MGQVMFSSIPGTKVIPWERAAEAASARPAVASWSVRASTVIPRSFALSTRLVGERFPSDAVEWLCKSIIKRL